MGHFFFEKFQFDNEVDLGLEFFLGLFAHIKQGNRHPRARQGGGVPAGVNHRAADQILP